MNQGNVKCTENSTKLANILKKMDYPCLTKEQEKELIFKFRDDREALNRELIMHNARMVYKIAKNYSTKSKDFDEMLARGFLGLAIAADRFDLNRNIKFSTYAYMWIFKFVVQEFNEEDFNVEAATKSLDQLALIDGDNGTTLENFIHSQIRKDVSIVGKMEDGKTITQRVDGKDVVNHIYEFLENSPDHDKKDIEIFTRTVQNGESAKAVSVDMDLPVSYVKETRDSIVQEIKEMLESRFNIRKTADVYA